MQSTICGSRKHIFKAIQRDVRNRREARPKGNWEKGFLGERSCNLHSRKEGTKQFTLSYKLENEKRQTQG